ncbi:MAG: hypothetical protein ABSH08_00945 [Tepidisphaeraceae bacterium]|jgi:hypothetical protein
MLRATTVLLASSIVLMTCQLSQGAAQQMAASQKPAKLIFRHTAEPREGAFTLLVPLGWKLDGGIFRVSPLQAGGVGNSLVAKCDFSVKDSTGAVMLRCLPTYNFVDFSDPRFANMAAIFPAGSHYNGMEVKPMLSAQDFLEFAFHFAHPNVNGAQIVERCPLPKLAEVYAKCFTSANTALSQIGLPPIQVTAAAMVVRYSEGGVTFKEALWAVLADNRGAAGQWCNQSTVLLRAPWDQADQCKPVLEIILRSIRIDLKWLANELKTAGENAKIALATQREIERLNDEIFRSREETNEQIQHDKYLMLTDQDEYVNPYTNEVETDTNTYRHRWVTENGDVLYDDNDSYNPNLDDQLWSRQWEESRPKR